MKRTNVTARIGDDNANGSTADYEREMKRRYVAFLEQNSTIQMKLLEEVMQYNKRYQQELSTFRSLMSKESEEQSYSFGVEQLPLESTDNIEVQNSNNISKHKRRNVMEEVEIGKRRIYGLSRDASWPASCLNILERLDIPIADLDALPLTNKISRSIEKNNAKIVPLSLNTSQPTPQLIPPTPPVTTLTVTNDQCLSTEAFYTTSECNEDIETVIEKSFVPDNELNLIPQTPFDQLFFDPLEPNYTSNNNPFGMPPLTPSDQYTTSSSYIDQTMSVLPLHDTFGISHYQQSVQKLSETPSFTAQDLLAAPLSHYNSDYNLPISTNTALETEPNEYVTNDDLSEDLFDKDEEDIISKTIPSKELIIIEHDDIIKPTSNNKQKPSSSLSNKKKNKIKTKGYIGIDGSQQIGYAIPIEEIRVPKNFRKYERRIKIRNSKIQGAGKGAFNGSKKIIKKGTLFLEHRGIVYTREEVKQKARVWWMNIQEKKGKTIEREIYNQIIQGDVREFSYMMRASKEYIIDGYKSRKEILESDEGFGRGSMINDCRIVKRNTRGRPRKDEFIPTANVEWRRFEYNDFTTGDLSKLINRPNPWVDLKLGPTLSTLEGAQSLIPHIFGIAMRDIKPGEELFFDYGAGFWKEFY